MSKALLSACLTTSVLVGLSAHAADLPTQKGPTPAPAVPVFTWTGFHVGLNSGFGGAVYGGSDAIAAPGLGGIATRTFDRASGSVVGGQLGYDYQFANGVLVGIETDMQWSTIKSSHQAQTTASDPSVATYSNSSQGLEWFGTTRARLGFSIGSVLPYVTGGVGYGEVSSNGSQVLAAGLITSTAASRVAVGWAAGAGLDIALSNKLSARAEYLYLQLPGVSGPAIGLTPPPLPTLFGSSSTGLTQAHIVRGGLNYRFGGLDDFVPSLPQSGLLAFLLEKPTRDWSGFYVGVNGGYGGGVVGGVSVFAQPGLIFSTYVSNRMAGAVSGGQLGYNRQFSNQVVVGIETDAQWSNVRASHQTTTFGGPGGFAFTNAPGPNAMTWFGTTQARLGYAMGSSLLYATGGVAYGEITVAGTQLSGGFFSSSGAQTRVGWAAGSGTEYALTENLSLKSDYVYVNFDGLTGSAVGIGAAPFTGNFKTGRFAASISRVGLNWRFAGEGTTPAVAKY